MPIEIQTPSQWARLADLFKLTGRHKLLLDEVVVPVVLMGDVADTGPEEPNLASAFVKVAATVGVRGGAMITNGQVGVNLVVTKIITSIVINVDIMCFLSDTVVGALIAASETDKQWNDSNRLDPTPGTPQGRDGGVFLGDPKLWQHDILARTPFTYETELIVAPGFSVIVVANLVNQVFDVSFQYRVEPAD